MKMNLYVIRDEAMQQSWNLAEAKNDTIAWREFEKLMKDREFANEFTLYNVGWWDHETDEGDLIKPREVIPNVEFEVEEQNVI